MNTLSRLWRHLWLAPRHLLMALVWLYQRLVSPLLPPTCRYHPSCSAYAVTALRRHGVLAGTVLATWRLLRCNPFTPGGVDDVPEDLWKRHTDVSPAATAGSSDSEFCAHPVPNS